MWPQIHTLSNGRELVIREAVPDDAPALLDYVQAISRESDFLAFEPGEFQLTVAEEEAYLRQSQQADNKIYIIGTMDGSIVAALTFSGGSRARMRHAGEFGVSVREACWGQGIGSRMVDALIAWARAGGVVTKINLKVRTDHRRAIALYERKGFVVEGTLRREIQIAGEYFDHYCMGMVL